MRSDAYTLDKMRRRVLAGLTPEETFEFELLDARIPFNGKPVCPSAEFSLSKTERRWLELFEKMDRSRGPGAASERGSIGKASPSDADVGVGRDASR